MNAAENTCVTGVGFYSLFLSAGISASVLALCEVLVSQTFLPAGVSSAANRANIYIFLIATLTEVNGER
jgi:hypothetical protein